MEKYNKEIFINRLKSDYKYKLPLLSLQTYLTAACLIQLPEVSSQGNGVGPFTGGGHPVYLISLSCQIKA